MKLTMLGTGSALVTKCYNTCFVISDGTKHFLVDGGGGNALLGQLQKAGLDWRELREIFVTHKHLDHLLGVLWMVRMICQHMKQRDYEGEAVVYGHDEVINLLRQLALELLPQKMSRFIDDRLHFVSLEDGEVREVIGHRTTFFDIRSTKAKQFGFSMELEQGERLTCCGDEPCSPGAEAYVRGSKWLLHEAFCLYGERDIFDPYEKHHSTVKDACELAEVLQVKNLLLYHTEEKNLDRREELYRAEGEQYYHGRLHIPRDLTVLEL